MRQDYDVIVVGGGPGGSTAAFVLARRGLDVALIERDEPPRHKTCGGGITNKTVRLNERVFGLESDEMTASGILNYGTHNVRLSIEDRLIKRVSHWNKLYFTDRGDYDYCLFRQAKKAGARTLTNTLVSNVNPDEDTIVLGDGTTLSYDLLIGADGVHSIVRNTLEETGLINCPHWDKQTAIGIEAYLSRDSLEDSRLDLEWGHLNFGFVNWGYGWIFPHQTQILVGIAGLQYENENISDTLDRYNELLDFDLTQADEIQGHPIPFGSYINEPATNNILLVGDAAGFVDPLTGEGIFYAQRSAELAGWAYEHAPNAVGQEYIQYVQEYILPELRNAWRFRPLFYGGPTLMRQYTLPGLGVLFPMLLDIVHGHQIWHDLSFRGEQIYDSVPTYEAN